MTDRITHYCTTAATCGNNEEGEFVTTVRKNVTCGNCLEVLGPDPETLGGTISLRQSLLMLQSQ